MMPAIVIAAYIEGIDPKLLEAVCYVETKLETFLPDRLDGGSYSYGMCQVKSISARHMGFKDEDVSLINPYASSHYAAKYIKYLLKRYSGNTELAIRAYNCGRIRGNCGKEYYRKVYKKWKNMKN